MARTNKDERPHFSYTTRLPIYQVSRRTVSTDISDRTVSDTLRLIEFPDPSITGWNSDGGGPDGI